MDKRNLINALLQNERILMSVLETFAVPFSKVFIVTALNLSYNKFMQTVAL